MSLIVHVLPSTKGTSDSESLAVSLLLSKRYARARRLCVSVGRLLVVPSFGSCFVPYGQGGNVQRGIHGLPYLAGAVAGCAGRLYLERPLLRSYLYGFVNRW